MTLPAGEGRWEQLTRIVAGWLRRWRVVRSVRWGGRGLVGGLAVGLAVAALLLNRGIILAGEYAAAIAAAGALGALFALAAGYLWTVNQGQAVRRFDLLFRLKERVSTAYELAAAGPAGFSGGRASPTDWRERQLADALQAAQRVQAGSILQIRLERWVLLACLGLALAAVLIGWLGRSQFQAAAQARQVAEAVQAEEAQLEALVEEIRQSDQLTPEQIEALTEPLQEALQALREAENAEQALSALQQAERELDALNTEQQARLQALAEAGQSLSQMQGTSQAEQQLRSAGQALAEGNLDQAGQAFSETNFEGLTPEQRQQIAQGLRQAAGQAGNTNPALAQALQEAADALENGDPAAAGQALQQAAGEVQEAQQQNQASDQAAQAAGELAEGQQQIAQAANQGGSQQANAAGPGSQSGQAGQSGQGNQGQNGAQQGQGSQSGPGSQSVQGSSGAGRGEGDGSAGQGSEAGEGPINQNNAPGDGGERPSEFAEGIYAPQFEGGGLTGIPGSGEEGETIGQLPADPGEGGQSRVPYTDALPAYLDSYRQAVETGRVPAYLLPVIRDYFSSLEP